MDDPTGYALDRLAARGFDKAQVHLACNERDELQAELGKPSMLRTIANTSLVLTGIVAGKRANTTLNEQDAEAIERAVDSLWLSAEASVADEANDIAPMQPACKFADDHAAPDRDAMYDRLESFLSYTASQYPTITMGVTNVSHLRARHVHANSNGAHFESASACYQANAHFGAKEGLDVSSMNGTSALCSSLDKPIEQIGSFDRLLKNTVEQVRTRKVGGKFSGDLVIAPDSVGAFIGFMVEHISRGPMVAGTSVYRDKLDTAVASDKLTLHAEPCSRLGGYRVTEDCFPASDATLVENGVLKSYLLDLYSARKTRLERSANPGGGYSIDSGTTSLEDLIKGVERGVLIGRFSGGRPSAGGDFSGIAKNSFYIENGKIAYPIAETMVSGNMIRLLTDISEVSTQRTDYGNSCFPWVRTTGVTVS